MTVRQRLVVTGLEDQPDAQPGDGICAVRRPPRPGPCTLRAAVMEANARPGLDLIVLSPNQIVLTRRSHPTGGGGRCVRRRSGHHRRSGDRWSRCRQRLRHERDGVSQASPRPRPDERVSTGNERTTTDRTAAVETVKQDRLRQSQAERSRRAGPARRCHGSGQLLVKKIVLDACVLHYLAL